MATITINDAEFYYELHGSGQPLVLISGYTGDSQYWLPLLPELTKYFQVLMVDNRGVGRTIDNGKELLSAASMADDIITLCKQLNLKKPHIVGSSMGGTIAQMIALNYPDVISKVGILVSSPKWRQAMLCGLGVPLKLREQNASFDIIFESIIPWLFSEDFLQSAEKIAELKTLLKTYPYPQSLANQQRQFKVLINFDNRENLDKIKAPTLIIYGTQDIIALPQEAKFMADRIPAVKLVEFNCAHSIVIEATTQLAHELITFFTA